MNHKVVFLNSPIGSGKDYIAEALCKGYGFDMAAFKTELYIDTANHFKMNVERFKALASDRNTKETPIDELEGISPRDALIHVSEVLTKPFKGKDYYGKKEAAKLTENGVTIYTDCGFKDEVMAVANKVGFNNCLLIHLQRDGCEFGDNDSRSRLDLRSYNIPSHFIDNNRDSELVVKDIIKLMSHWFGDSFTQMEINFG